MSVSRPRGAARIALVTPWFGPDLRGGAEQQSWQLAAQLTARGHAVDVLTTCCAGFDQDWSSNGLRAGTEHRGALNVRRFKVRSRDRRAFERVNAILTSLGPAELRRGVSPVSDDDARLFYENNIHSPGLYTYLAAEGDSYEHVLFLPYLYGPTLFGLPLVAARAFLQPCLHDEAYAYLPRVAETVHAAKGLLFNSDGEYELALRLFGPGIVAKSTVIGEGVDVGGFASLPEQVGPFVPAREKYVLYLGRQHPVKNLPLLVSAFAEFRRRRPASRLRLVLAGERPVSYGDSAKGILDLGPVGEAEKAALLHHACALAQPSTSESFSRVVHEAWACGRPAIVHSGCLPTAGALARCGGGYAAGSSEEWVEALERVDVAGRDELQRLGGLGRAYAARVSSWPAVIERYESVFAASGEPGAGAAPGTPERIVQVLPHDADANMRAYAIALSGALHRAGIEDVELLAGAAGNEAGGASIRHRYAGAAEPAARDEITIYHASPAHPWPPPGAQPSVAPAEPACDAFASSPAALLELERHHARSARWLPVCVDSRQWDAPADVPLISALQDGKQNLLYAGRIDSFARMSELLIVFLHYLTLEREARLTILATDTIVEDVNARLFNELRRLELADRVLVAREVAGDQLQAIFRTADVFVSLDEAESSGLEFLQAMWFDVPIVAHRTAIARELVGPCGLLINDKSDLLAVAALIQIVATDPLLRAQAIAAQRRVRERCDEPAVVAALLASLRARRSAPSATEASTLWPS